MSADPDYYDVWISALTRPDRDGFRALLLRYADVDLDLDLARCLVMVGLHQPVGVLALAELLGQNHPKASRTLAELEARGLVRRSRGADQRIRTAECTPAGRGLVDRVNSGRRRLLADVFRDWDRADQVAFARLSQRFNDRVAELVDSLAEEGR